MCIQPDGFDSFTKLGSYSRKDSEQDLILILQHYIKKLLYMLKSDESSSKKQQHEESVYLIKVNYENRVIFLVRC